MSFLRPAVIAALKRWQETMIWGGAILVSLWLAWNFGPLGMVLGGILGVVGAALGWGAWRRMRLGTAPPGPGVVVIDEGRIGLLGPLDGGFVDVPSLVSVAVEGQPQTAGRAWILRSEDGTRLVVPFGAVGAEGLPDALAALPGIDFGAAERGPAVLWERQRGKAPRLSKR